MLKAHVVFINGYNSKSEVEAELRNLNHDLIEIGKKLGEGELRKIGIAEICVRDSADFLGYIVKTIDGKQISIENFTDIRYDFTNDSLRALPQDTEFRDWFLEAMGILSKLKKMHYGSQ